MDTAHPGNPMLNCTNHSRERKRGRSDAGQTKILEIVALRGRGSGWQGEGLRGGWLLLPQASCGLKGVRDPSLPESAGSQAWHFAGLSPSSQ